MKKYEFTGETKVIAGVTLKRIRALISFGFIVKGEIGGFIESEKNLSHDGNARVTGNAEVTGNADCMLIGRIGSRSDFTTFFKNKDGGISVRCGCFYGTIEEFREKVEETHGTDTKHAKVYQAAANLAEMQILEQEAE
jgi:hypothetical protein